MEVKVINEKAFCLQVYRFTIKSKTQTHELKAHCDITFEHSCVDSHQTAEYCQQSALIL